MLEMSPTDIEAWAELSGMYFSQGLLEQATFCLEEILLVAPNAWNVSIKESAHTLLESAKIKYRFMLVLVNYDTCYMIKDMGIAILETSLKQCDGHVGALSSVMNTSGDITG